MSKFKPGDRVRYIDESPNAAVRTVIGPRPDDPSFVVLWTHRASGYLTVKVDDLELAPDTRQEAIEKAAEILEGELGWDDRFAREAVEALAAAGLLKEPSDD